MPEITAILVSKRDSEYQERKFLAALKGVNLEDWGNEEKGQKEWEDMKARVYSGGKSTDSGDIISLQGQNARKSGFGIGNGLEYQSSVNAKNPMS